jgi:hypothetical protein
MIELVDAIEGSRSQRSGELDSGMAIGESEETAVS